MAINITLANNHASSLLSYLDQLRQVKTQLASYKLSVLSNWQGQEVQYITLGIDQTVSQIDNVILQLESISTDIKNVAEAIKREEEVAAAAATRAKEEKIKKAQISYDDALKKLDDLNREKEKLEKELYTSSAFRQIDILKTIEELNKKIQTAQQNCNDCKTALDLARR